MPLPAEIDRLPPVLHDVITTAAGANHRDDPIIEGTGGPAGNARLTAWLGLALLGFFLAEGVTLLSVGGLITAHILIGAFLVPLALAKTATTGWRIVRYYVGSTHYRQAGPPPTLLRLLGPLVVFGALAVLGSGLALIALGSSSYRPLITIAGFGINALTIHKASFVFWLVVTALHVLTRTVPAVKVAANRAPHHLQVSGGTARLAVLIATFVIGVAVSIVVLHLSGDWTNHRLGHFGQ